MSVTDSIETPYYLIDENRMLKKLEIIDYVRKKSSAKVLLALKCFSGWCAFDFMSKYMDGTTSSSLYEAKLGYDKFGGETHGYCVAYTIKEVIETARYCGKIIFNSLNQLYAYKDIVKGRDVSVGLRINPQTGFSSDFLSDPTRRYSRLGVLRTDIPYDIHKDIDGLMFHCNCENNSFERFEKDLNIVCNQFDKLLGRVKWVSLGGGISFTSDNYPVDDFCRLLKDFSQSFGVQVYLEPGEAAVTFSVTLTATILDIVFNEIKTAIVDAAAEPHLLDVLTYGYGAEVRGGKILAGSGKEEFNDPGYGYIYAVCGRTCLAGDRFGTYVFEKDLKIGDRLNFINAGGYSMVKKNWFNGLRMPLIVHKKIGGSLYIASSPSYEDFKRSMS